jgi:sortase A
MRKNGVRKLEAALLAIGLTLLAIFLVFRIHSILASRAALREFAQMHESIMTGAPQKVRAPDPSLWSDKRIEAYKQSLSVPMDGPIAVLTIPRLSLEVPVFDGTDEIVLNRGTGRIEGTARPGEEGNIGIAGHRDGFFRGLKDIQAGDRIQLATLKGNTVYIVDRTEIVSPDNISVLQPTAHPALTLVTCYPFYFVGNAPERFIVRASIAELDPPDNRKSNVEVKTTHNQEATK